MTKDEAAGGADGSKSAENSSTELVGSEPPQALADAKGEAETGSGAWRHKGEQARPDALCAEEDEDEGEKSGQVKRGEEMPHAVATQRAQPQLSDTCSSPRDSSQQQQQQVSRQPRRSRQPSEVASSTTTTTTTRQTPVSADYLAQLIKDKKQLAALPAVFMHVPRLVEEEINKVRQSLFQLQDVSLHPTGSSLAEPLELPEPDGSELVQLQEKIYVPVGEHPEYNFVGRILGPRGMTAKQLEQETGCKIMIRGRGSMRDKKKEEQNRGKANWEHLNDELHVLITVEDTQNRAELKLKRALEEVKQLLVPIVDGEDELKKRQLMELAIINGTYRDCNYNEALTKMLNDYRTSGETHTGQQHHHRGHQHHHYGLQSGPQQQQQVYHHLANMNGSSVSSGVPSSGSNTPNSVSGASNPKQLNAPAAAAAVSAIIHQPAPPAPAPPPPPPPPPGGSPHLATAVAAAAAAAAAAQQQHQHHAHLHHPLPQMSGPHQAPHQANVVQAAAAAAALIAASPDAGLMYAHHHHAHHHHHQQQQQYHDFQHYAAAMAAAAAAAAQPALLAPADYAHPHYPQTTSAAASNPTAPCQSSAGQQQQQVEQQAEHHHHQAAAAAAAAAAALAYHQQHQQHLQHLHHQLHHHHHHQQHLQHQLPHQQQQQQQQDSQQDQQDNGGNNHDEQLQESQESLAALACQQVQQAQQQQQAATCGGDTARG